ncbi:hypothetical protein T4B_3890 [Trichinella pseudospiralis]|uniref:Uncharacterized protein n=1 Tax=Trichinella pseudospiralis TaxID=6337 RepID=A0A0V1GB95_TRIPS|nr:hypothetical protein T4B_3890 [Trichinella pseudospiralis]
MSHPIDFRGATQHYDYLLCIMKIRRITGLAELL